jgi:hypothetical protein
MQSEIGISQITLKSIGAVLGVIDLSSEGVARWAIKKHC